MAATPSPAWKGLPSTDDSWLKNTKLFFTFQKREEGPKLQVTDLVYIWTAAKTSREELTEEAARTRCSIDPSEDEEQYNVLLSKLEEAVAGQNGGMVTVVGYGNASTSFEMEASIPLPTPLGMLEWTFSMVRGKPAVFTQEVVVPALHAVETRRRREEELRRKIKEKDHVIGKLMDKIESSSIDLSMVFPGFAGARKGLNSRQAAKVVPGIEPFSGEGWEGKSLVGNDAGVGGIIEALRDPETGELKWKALLDLMVSATGDEENSNVPIGSVESSKQNQVTGTFKTSED